MTLDYINEAFKRLSLLEEEAFDTSLHGINALSDFKEADLEDNTVDIIDPQATTEEDIEKSYIGKVITNCNVCHSHIFENKEEIELDDEGIVNGNKECPYCGETAGFMIVGEITEFIPEAESDEVKVSVDGETVPVEEAPKQEIAESKEKNFKPHTKRLLRLLGEEDNNLNETTLASARPTRDLVTTDGTIANVLNRYMDDIRACGNDESRVKDLITDILLSGEVSDQEKANSAVDIIRSCSGGRLWSTLATFITGNKAPTSARRRRRYEKMSDNSDASVATDDSLVENVNNVNVETDDSIVNIQSEEGGKVTVSTEPKEATPTGEEAIGPLSDETLDEIVMSEEPTEDELAPTEEPSVDEESEEVDVEIDDVEEPSLDELGEAYLKNVYENVKSFKTTSVSSDDKHLVVEGLIQFNSGVQKRTGFIFEADSASTSGKVRFTGKNEHFSRGSKAFTLTGRIEDKKLISESLTYRYMAKNSTGTPTRIYGTVYSSK